MHACAFFVGDWFKEDLRRYYILSPVVTMKLPSPSQRLYSRYGVISKTSRFYIGLAVGLPVFSNILLILTGVQTVLSLQGKAT